MGFAGAILMTFGLSALAVTEAPSRAPAVPAEVRAVRTDAEAPLPQRLSETGLYEAGSTTHVRAGNLPFVPQYPLWSDGTSKRRWIHVPAGASIDASNPDAWEFPAGTRLWKEFALERPIETRMLERLADGSWRFAAYVWTADGADAVLAPQDGTSVPLPGRPAYRVPSRTDCLACHEGGPVPVLGFGALQLSPDRDPLAPNAERVDARHVDLSKLAALGWLRNLPRRLLRQPPRIEAATPTARAAMGYLHANCGHCHNGSGALAGLDLTLAQQVSNPNGSATATVESLLRSASAEQPSGATPKAIPARAALLARRIASSNPYTRMPPLGVTITDREGVAVIERWIREDLQR